VSAGVNGLQTCNLSYGCQHPVKTTTTASVERASEPIGTVALICNEPELRQLHGSHRPRRRYPIIAPVYGGMPLIASAAVPSSGNPILQCRTYTIAACQVRSPTALGVRRL